MKRRPPVMLILLLLVAGAIVNVAAAWGHCWKEDIGDWTIHGPSASEVLLAESAFGWPARSLSNDPSPKAFEARRYSLTMNEPRLPLLPLWPGFAINTVFFAAVLWLLFAAPFALRRLRGRRRIKRGLCPKCAYPVSGTAVCSECGAAVKPRRGDGM